MKIIKCFIIFACIFNSSEIFAQEKNSTLYLIPGQGSDYRIFKHFKFQDFDTVHIKYIIPEEIDDMKSYARKLSTQIDTCEPFSVIGVSLGGMIAVEMSEFLKPEKVILISSAKNRHELPFRYKFMKKVPLNNVFNGSFLRSVAPLAQIIVEPDSRKERETCLSMLNNKNEQFMKYSVNMIINWERLVNHTDIIHIHGDNDHTIPIRNIKHINYIVKNGSHMMALTKGEFIKEIVEEFLTK